MSNKQRWIASSLVVVGAALGGAIAMSGDTSWFGARVDASVLGNHPQPRALLRLVNESVGPIHGLVRMDRSSWAFFVPLHESKDLSLPEGPATVEISGAREDVRAVTLVGGQTTTIEVRGER